MQKTYKLLLLWKNLNKIFLPVHIKLLNIKQFVQALNRKGWWGDCFRSDALAKIFDR